MCHVPRGQGVTPRAGHGEHPFAQWAARCPACERDRSDLPSLLEPGSGRVGAGRCVMVSPAPPRHPAGAREASRPPLWAAGPWPSPTFFWHDCRISSTSSSRLSTSLAWVCRSRSISISSRSLAWKKGERRGGGKIQGDTGTPSHRCPAHPVNPLLLGRPRRPPRGDLPCHGGGAKGRELRPQP